MSLLPGASYRTPGKHDALDKLLGKVTGAATTERFNWRKFFIYDLTAGDGKCREFSNTNSPEIIAKHASYAKSKGLDVRVRLYERSAVNADGLREVVRKHKDRIRLVVRNKDCSEMNAIWNPDDMLFVVNDPNTVNDWCIPEALYKAPDLTLILSTLGCNVGGLKRLPFEDRQLWFYHMEGQLSLLCYWHDSLLVTLDGDSAQWAYLVNAPEKWRGAVEKMFKKAFEYTGHELVMAWWRRDADNFVRLRDVLFKTEKERSS